jgi:F0F1-type ATP synthase beta subunit
MVPLLGKQPLRLESPGQRFKIVSTALEHNEKLKDLAKSSLIFRNGT